LGLKKKVENELIQEIIGDTKTTAALFFLIGVLLGLMTTMILMICCAKPTKVVKIENKVQDLESNIVGSSGTADGS
jgi:uncharacterized membrane protein YuzA (DUF378 family)